MARSGELMMAGRAAIFLGISRDTLKKWNRAGQGPPRMLKGKRYWYSRELLREWIMSGGVASLATRAPSQPQREPPRSPSSASTFQPQNQPHRFR